MSRGRLIGLLSALLLLVACAAPGGAPTPAPPPATLLIPTVTAGPAPQIALAGLDGESHTLDEWRGKIVLVNYWATWCIPCRNEMPLLAELATSDPEVVVVGVNFQESPEQAAAFVEELALPFPILLDEEGQLARKLGVLGLPTTYFLDREGRLVQTRIGELRAEELAERVERLRSADDEVAP